MKICPIAQLQSEVNVSLQPLSSGQTMWYYLAAVSVFAAAVGLFGMIAALSANRKAVKAFEALYFFSLMTQFALIIWGLVWCTRNQSEFDTICNASKNGEVNLPIPGFASNWTCQKIYLAGILTISIGGVVWVAFNFYMTNRVIHYARELYSDKTSLYKVLDEVATKELDREQQVPLNYTNPGSSMADQEYHESHQPSYRDEIQYKDPRSGDSFQQPRASGFGPYGQDLSNHHQQHPIALGFGHRDSAQGLDLINPYHGEQDTFAMENIPSQNSYAPASYLPPGSGPSFSNNPMSVQTSFPHQGAGPAFVNAPVGPSTAFSPQGSGPSFVNDSVSLPASFPPQGSGQAFVHASTSKIPSPFGDDEPLSPVAHSPHDGIKVLVPPSPQVDVRSPTEQTLPADILSPSIDYTDSK
ncbi:hypothetical protein BGZ49_001796 [Haplosporangium sp. Z 27]|nr:hypothetical protein BGZ49_001796 [Haplosporangium sp. Z 27]